MTESELRKFEKELEYEPEGVRPPEVMSANKRSLDIWSLIEDQVRVGLKGKAYAMDLASVAIILDKIGIKDIEWELIKQKTIFAKMRGK